MPQNWIDSTYKKDLVSVIIPTYNREELLAEAIYSVYNQLYSPIECIVVDDGSTDNTSGLVKELIKKLVDDNFIIKYEKQTNTGAPSARNLGTILSSGEFIQYLDSDDLLYPKKIASQVLYLQENKTVDGVFGDWDKGTSESKETIKGEKSDNLLLQFYGGRVIHTMSFLFRRCIVQKIGPWDINLKRNQEIDFNLRGVLANGQFEYFPINTGLWRDHSGERIINNDKEGYGLHFHKKWINEFKKKNILSKDIKKVAAIHFFTKSLIMDSSHKKEIISNLLFVKELDPYFPNFNSPKMNILFKVLGKKNALKVWYKKYLKYKSNNFK